MRFEDWFQAGLAALAADDTAQAGCCFEQATTLAPQRAEGHANWGLVLERQGRHAEAEASYRRALELDDSQAQAWVNYGALLAQQDRLDEAQDAYLSAIERDLTLPGAWSNLGALYTALQQDTDAEHCLRRALAIAPQHRKARFNLACLLLAQGRMDEGWSHFEARDWYEGLAQRLPMPRWNGQAWQGLRVLLVFEAGHGDVIQFIRYADALRQKGCASLGLLCQPALQPLMQSLPALDRVLSLDDSVSAQDWDVWVPLMSAPYLLGTTLATIPATLPYLQSDPQRRAALACTLPSAPLRVGLVWKGNPKFENDADRSLPHLRSLAPLARCRDVLFVSLQKGAGHDEVAQAPPGMQLVDLAPALADFADTAAAVASLDLVIGVDTAVAHLAGALGKPCWVLLPQHMPDWRWLRGRSDSPWYPKVMRLFRQPRRGDWDTVIEEVAQQLAMWGR